MPLFKDENGNYKLNYQKKYPFHFEVQYLDDDGKSYPVGGIFDEREFDTEEKVEQEAKYRLKVDRRPDVQGGISPEVNALLTEYNHKRACYISLMDNISYGIFTQEEKQDKLDSLRTEIRDLYGQILETGHPLEG